MDDGSAAAHVPSSSSQEAAAAGLGGPLLLGGALLLVLALHGSLLFNQSFVRSYDALIHIFFASHYAEAWFDPWETRWYTGFFTVAYPPLSHQLTALLSRLIDLRSAFALVQLGALLGLTIGVYRFSRILFSARAAGYAALALALSSSVAETAHLFGQLPTLLSLALLLNGLPFVWRYLMHGARRDLVKAVAFTAATTAAHHVTTLFGSLFFVGPLVLVALLSAFRSPRPGEPQGAGLGARLRRRGYRLLPRGYRTGLFGVLAIAMLVLVVFPYWYWSGTDPILQVSIPHGSRENFLANPQLGLIFWLIPWASTLWALPYLVYKGLAGWRWPLAASALLLTLLGTGGTTPLPQLLLRGAYDILTLDRFTFWATIMILPFVGAALDSAIHGRLGSYLNANFGRRVRWGLLLALGLATVATTIGVSTLARYRTFQPDPIAIEPIVDFIEKDEHWRYRYLTLGFGDQMAWLAANTRATTPDGNYHSARRLPELTTTPIERLEGAKYTGVPGIGSLTQFLTTPERFHLKFVFSNDAFYDPLLFFSGWHRLGRLENGIQVWEREDIPPLPERLPRRSWPLAQRLLWGLLPPLALVLALLTLALPQAPRAPPRPAGRRTRLLREDALAEVAPSGWQPWRRWLTPLARLLTFHRRPLGYRWRASLALAALLLVPVVLVVQSMERNRDDPEQAVLRYWDHLDFKRFEAAYAWIEPEQGLTFERWRLERSLIGGLRSGFAKLDTIETELVAYQGSGRPGSGRLGDRALVRTQLTWLTALAEREEVVEQRLVRTRAGWRVAARPQQFVRPPNRFEEIPQIGYYRSPRRLTTEVTAAGDILDRPRLEVREARLVRHLAVKTPLELEAEAVFTGLLEEELEPEATRFTIVGVLVNIDARPADVTLTGVLRDRFGNALAQANAGTIMMHKLLPGESTPFRIDFSTVAAPAEAEAVADFEIFAKGVVTARELDRELALWSRWDGSQLEFSVANVGTEEATIPHVLVELYDEDGLAWVTEGYGLEAVAPRERRELVVAVDAPRDYTLLAWQREGSPSASTVTRFDLDHALFDAYRAVAHAFRREE